VIVTGKQVQPLLQVYQRMYQLPAAGLHAPPRSDEFEIPFPAGLCNLAGDVFRSAPGGAVVGAFYHPQIVDTRLLKVVHKIEQEKYRTGDMVHDQGWVRGRLPEGIIHHAAYVGPGPAMVPAGTYYNADIRIAPQIGTGGNTLVTDCEQVPVRGRCQGRYPVTGNPSLLRK